MCNAFLDTAQRDFVEAQATPGKAPILTAPFEVATSPRPIVTSSVTVTSHVLLRQCMLVTFRLADTVAGLGTTNHGCAQPSLVYPYRSEDAY